MSAATPEPRKPVLAASLILAYRAREHEGAAEVALDACDFAEYQRQKSLARLERAVAEGEK